MNYTKISIKYIALLFIFCLLCFNGEVNADSSIDTTINVDKTITSAPPKVKNTFGYKITPDSNNPGIVTGLNDSFEIKFEDIKCSNGIAILRKSINFNNLNYSKPGDYKFKVEENSTADEVSYPLASEKWDIVLSVRYKTIDNVPTRELIVKGMAIVNPETGSKDNDALSFTSDAVFTDIRIFNDTKGNMSDLNKYFKIKVNIKGEPGDVYTIYGQDPTVNYNGKMIETLKTYIVGDTPQYIYLKDDQDVTIGKRILAQGSEVRAKENKNYQQEIKIGTKYSVEEIGSEAYKTYINNSDKPNKKSSEYTLDKNTGIINILNIYEAEILTGNFLKVLPYVLILLIASISLVLIIRKRKTVE